MDRKIICSCCGAELIKDGAACPVCKSKKYTVKLGIQEHFATHEKIHVKEKDVTKHGKKKFYRELTIGDDYSREKKKYVDRSIDIDRINDNYIEIVKDKETGEIIHKCSEPLSKHRGHGSAKEK